MMAMMGEAEIREKKRKLDRLYQRAVELGDSEYASQCFAEKLLLRQILGEKAGRSGWDKREKTAGGPSR